MRIYFKSETNGQRNLTWARSAGSLMLPVLLFIWVSLKNSIGLGSWLLYFSFFYKIYEIVTLLLHIYWLDAIYIGLQDIWDSYKFTEIGNIRHRSSLLVMLDSFSVFLVHLTYFLYKENEYKYYIWYSRCECKNYCWSHILLQTLFLSSDHLLTRLVQFSWVMFAGLFDNASWAV